MELYLQLRARLHSVDSNNSEDDCLLLLIILFRSFLLLKYSSLKSPKPLHSELPNTQRVGEPQINSEVKNR
jgi:hypothetical protein